MIKVLLAVASSTTTTVPVSSSSSTSHPAIAGTDLTWLVAFLVLVVAVIIAMPILLSRAYSHGIQRAQSSAAQSKLIVPKESGSESAGQQTGQVAAVPSGALSNAPASFFQIDYITWFLLHYMVAALAVVVIAILALDGVIDASVISALLGSLLGYVLGTASAQHSSTTKPTTNGCSSPSIGVPPGGNPPGGAVVGLAPGTIAQGSPAPASAVPVASEPAQPTEPEAPKGPPGPGSSVAAVESSAIPSTPGQESENDSTVTNPAGDDSTHDETMGKAP